MKIEHLYTAPMSVSFIWEIDENFVELKPLLLLKYISFLVIILLEGY